VDLEAAKELGDEKAAQGHEMEVYS
jgi:hypothetical protein